MRIADLNAYGVSGRRLEIDESTIGNYDIVTRQGKAATGAVEE